MAFRKRCIIATHPSAVVEFGGHSFAAKDIVISTPDNLTLHIPEGVKEETKARVSTLGLEWGDVIDAARQVMEANKAFGRWLSLDDSITEFLDLCERLRQN